MKEIPFWAYLLSFIIHIPIVILMAMFHTFVFNTITSLQ